MAGLSELACTGGRDIDADHKSSRGSVENSEDECEILEESPCKRWLKRREEVKQRGVPGIDCAYLAMDAEFGVEVVWNEVQFSERKIFKDQEVNIQQVFENLSKLEHPNIVKFHLYWIDTHNDKPRVIFITEYMSDGSLKQFLKRTRGNGKKLPLTAWKRFCTQILSALSYLHSCSPPIIHSNLTCDTIFIQHDGLVKIGSVAPGAIHHHVKTFNSTLKNIHFIAPEYGIHDIPAVDVYSFGMCALEMAASMTQGHGDSGTLVTDDQIALTIDSLEDPCQKDFIQKCLNKNHLQRPSVKELLCHPLLKLAHTIVNSSSNVSETITDEEVQSLFQSKLAVADITHCDKPPTHPEKLVNFEDDLKSGTSPLTALIGRVPLPPLARAVSVESADSVKSFTLELFDIEKRRVVNMMCNIKPKVNSCELCMTILLRMDDKMNRRLTCPISELDEAILFSQELVNYGFINDCDREKLSKLINDTIQSYFFGPTNPVVHSF